MKIIKHSHITKTQGFTSEGVASGVKKNKKLDLGLLFSRVPATTAAVYTTNSVKAAPLAVCEEHLKDGITQAIVVNSGNANCFTGREGYLLAKKTAADAAKILKIKTSDVLVASTGIIGKRLPYEKIRAVLPTLATSLKATEGAGERFAKSTLTTDKETKSKGVIVKLGGISVTISACAKGSGMLAPNMATMLCFITTDCNIDRNLLQSALKEAVNTSFNMITVDGCMSTNDMVVIMANGLAKNTKISKKSKDYLVFKEALAFVCLELAKKLVRDGEGATKFIQVTIQGASTFDNAKRAAFAVANSFLVKTAAHGENPNWGRIAQALGTVGLGITEKNLKIHMSSFKKKDITITANIGPGKASATVYTSDLSHEYVRINAEYN